VLRANALAWRAVACLWMGFVGGAAHADDEPARVVAHLSSPGEVLSVDLLVDNDRPYYRVMRFGEPVLAPSRLGFILKDAGKLDRDFAITTEPVTRHDATWEQPWGERRYVRDHYAELRAHFVERHGAKRGFDVVFRAYDDGIGFRYEFAKNAGVVTISDELTEFNVARPATAWWIPWGEPNDTELLFHTTPLAEVSVAHTPFTMRTVNGLHLEIHEAALVDYAAMSVRRVEGQRLVASLTPASEGWKVRRTGPFTTPWRMLVAADTAGGLYESNLMLNLNEPNRLGDVSWVKPGKFLGIWWEMFREEWTWASGAHHGATTEHAKQYIDFAAAHGFRGVLIEGWNDGWNSAWAGDGRDFSFTKSYPDFDLPAVAAYARSKGVMLIGHHETGGAVSHYEDEVGAAFDLYQRVGVDTVKTGYVTDADQIHRRDDEGQERTEWHDGQFMANHYLKVVTEAAKRHIMIDSHEPIKDTGLRRTYPNWLAREGARGQEYNAFGRPVNPPEHESILVYTRMLGGPMDFTPGILVPGEHVRPCCRPHTTVAKQLAMYVVLYSPLQMAADRIENYQSHPGPFRFIEDVPTDWDETLAVNGEIGDYVTLVRKDRHSDDWYLGSVTDEEGRVLTVPLGFLAPNRRYEAQIYRDAPTAHWRDHPEDLVIERREVTSSDRLELKLAPGGGEAIRFRALPLKTR